ncbi:MAG: TonB-dependent receptor plug domain-containing protein, partial [Gemmatimonadales bacterium]|nr:TonB-dependent receptor plug domain-containing protein [Gemmatimonadales bacterium]
MMRPRLAGFLGFSLSVLLALAAPVSAQQATIAGRVIDGSTMQPLASVQVQIVGSASATGVLSDASGNFSISVSSGSYSVVFTLIGHQTHRVDGVSVANGGTERVEVQMTSTVLALDPLSVTVNRGREERTSVAPAQVNVVTAELIEEISATSAVDYVKAMPGVDVIQTGINQSNTVTRGFNNVFSGALLVLTDNRYARVPSLRLNAYNMIPATPLDV